MNKIAAYLPTDSNNHWGSGCENCAYGIVSAPALTGACSLHLERLVQAIAKDLTFCTCQAGTRYHANLLNLRRKLIEEARRDPRMQEQAARLSHPDIEAAAEKIAAIFANMPAPTIHAAEQAPVTA